MKQINDCFIYALNKLMFKIIPFTDENFFYDSVPQGLINNMIFGINGYDAFPPGRTPLIISLRYFGNNNNRFSSRT